MRSAWPCSEWCYRAVRVAPHAGALLPHRCTLTCDRRTGPSAVSLCCTSVRSPRPGSRQHSALWSPDFPRHGRCSCRGHPADSPRRRVYGPSAREGQPVGAGVERVDERVQARRLEVQLQAHAVLVAVAADVGDGATSEPNWLGMRHRQRDLACCGGGPSRRRRRCSGGRRRPAAAVVVTPDRRRRIGLACSTRVDRAATAAPPGEPTWTPMRIASARNDGSVTCGMSAWHVAADSGSSV